MKINTNIPALGAQRSLDKTQEELANRLLKLTTGYKINRAADDAAGLAISEKLRSQVSGIGQEATNELDLISRNQVAEGGLGSTSDALQRMRELTVQSANGTLTDQDKELINKEVAQLQEQIDYNAQTTQFNTKQVIPNATTTDLGIDKGSIDIVSDPQAALEKFDAAINMVSEKRADLGAETNRSEHKINGLLIAQENTMAAESRIRDADMAFEMMHLVRSQILEKSGVIMAGHANVQPKTALGLLGGA
ncbi:flagellin [bacterium]|nr:flagellin [bacterium]MBU1153887.1 flagellin [bacterium]MBU1782722.1 flagellin [bacterium]MBU2599741.1 flagellin [bacterium]